MEEAGKRHGLKEEKQVLKKGEKACKKAGKGVDNRKRQRCVGETWYAGLWGKPKIQQRLKKKKKGMKRRMEC